MSNKSEQDVTIKINFIKSDGTVCDEITESGGNIRIAGITTDPVNTAGALLSANTSATINNTALGASAFDSATLTLESTTCLVNPLKVSARKEWVNKSDSWIEVNNGNRL